MADRAEVEARNILVAAPSAIAHKLGEILSDAGYRSNTVCTSGEQALAEAAQQTIDVLVTTYRLGDMTGEELIRQMSGLGGAVLITPPDGETTQELPDNVIVMYNPLNKDVFLQTIHVLGRMGSQVVRLQREVSRLERMLAERKLIERAKGQLMNERSMSEADAHHYMQKMSMDTGKRLADVAREILEEKMAV